MALQTLASPGTSGWRGTIEITWRGAIEYSWHAKYPNPLVGDLFWNELHMEANVLENLNNENIGWCNGLVLSGNKSLPEPMLTEIYDAIWRH